MVQVKVNAHTWIHPANEYQDDEITEVHNLPVSNARLNFTFDIIHIVGKYVNYSILSRLCLTGQDAHPSVSSDDEIIIFIWGNEYWLMKWIKYTNLLQDNFGMRYLPSWVEDVHQQPAWCFCAVLLNNGTFKSNYCSLYQSNYQI